MKHFTKILTAILLVGAMSACSWAAADAVTETHVLDYDHQDEWEFESGDSQSPINIVPADAKAMEDAGAIVLNYDHEAEADVDNGHAIEVELEGEATINGRIFHLSQFHIHAQSEHTVDGAHYPAEIHFVNKAQDGRIAVVAVFLKAGAENAAFQDVLENVTEEGSSKEFAIDVNQLIPANKTFYHYLGSLTTPPLSENVEWYVMANPVEVSQAQIDAFNQYYSHNNRDIQDLNGRAVVKHTE